ncbi:MAG: YdjY domain-containing protein [Verrucomicrobiia bacterium]
MRGINNMNFKVILTTVLTALTLPIFSQTVTNNPVKQIAPDLFEIGLVRLDSKNKTVTVPATVNMNEGQIEYLLVSTAGKLHESLLKTKAEPYHVQVAMLLLNSKPTPSDSYYKNAENPIPGEPVSIKLKWKTDSGEKTVAAEELIFNIIRKKTLIKGNWNFNGSRIIEGAFIAQRDRSIIAIKPDIDAIFNNPVSCKENENDWIVNTNFSLSVGMPVEVIIELKQSN